MTQPFEEADLSKPLTKKTSKILREARSVLIEDGSKAAPLGEQFYNYISKFPEKIKETDKKILEDEVVRKRIDDALPP